MAYEPTVSGLIQFLLDRLVEDEMVANNVRDDERTHDRDDSDLGGAETERGSGYLKVAVSSGRILAECRVKRGLVEDYQALAALSVDGGEHSPAAVDTAHHVVLPVLEYSLRRMGAVYWDHPGYREDWRPQV